MIDTFETAVIVANGVGACGGKHCDRGGGMIRRAVPAQIGAFELRGQGEEPDSRGLPLEEYDSLRTDGVGGRRDLLARIPRLEMDAAGRIETKPVGRTGAVADGTLEHDTVDLRSREGSRLARLRLGADGACKPEGENEKADSQDLKSRSRWKRSQPSPVSGMQPGS